MDLRYPPHIWEESEDFGPKVYTCLNCCRLISAAAHAAKIEEFKEMIRTFGATHNYFVNDKGEIVRGSLAKEAVVADFGGQKGGGGSGSGSGSGGKKGGRGGKKGRYGGRSRRR